MAVTAAQKAEFLEQLGEVKSLQYFMTGPNLGPDWSWSKALAGTYTPSELAGHLDKAKVAYGAHKAKDKATPAPAGAPGPEDPAGGLGAACAKSAAKTIVNAVSELKQAISAAYSNSWPLQGLKIFDGSVHEIDDLQALHLKLNALVKEAFSETGNQTPEWLAGDAMKGYLETLTVAKEAVGVTFDHVQAGALDVGEYIAAMMNARATILARRSAFLKRTDLLDEVLAEVDTKGGQKLASMMADWANEIGTEVDARLTAVYQDMIEAAGWGSFEQLLTVVDFYDLKSATEILKNVREQIEGLVDVLGWDDAAQVTELLKSTTVMSQQQAFAAALNEAMDSQFTKLAEGGGWLGDVPGILSPSSWLHQYQDFDSFLADVKAYEQASLLGQASTPTAKVWSANFLDQIEQTFNASLEIAQAQIPVPTPTVASVKQALSLDQVNLIKAAGTDELNPMVKAALEEAGETPSLAYFMTKQQKVDFLTMDPEEFAAKLYSVKVKDPASGHMVTLNQMSGLTGPKVKYSAKTGSPAPAVAPVTKPSIEDALAASTKTPDVVAGGVNPLTGEKTLPPGSPKWWGDPATDNQHNFIQVLWEQEGFNAPGKDPFEGSAFALYSNTGTLTKGQAHHLISAMQEGKIKTSADVDLALNYGVKKVRPIKAVVDAADAGPGAPGAVEEAVKIADSGPVVSGSKPMTSAAPSNPVWDEPHTFTYMGDGQSKWGGAHRKWWFQDEAGNDWMLKHGADFRSEGELAAHRLAHAAGFDIPEARISTLSVSGRSQKGFMQRMYRKDDIVGELGDVNLTTLSPETLAQIQQHQVLDWLIGNHDSHSGNFLILKDGRVVGVDKGQAFKFYGKDRLAHDYKPSGNFGEIVYNRMWSEYRAGRLALDLNSIEDALARVEALSDDQVRDLVAAYARGRFSARFDQAFLTGTAARSEGELIDLVLARKRNIRAEFESFYRGHADARGESWAGWGPAPNQIVAVKPAVQSAADVLTPIDQSFAASLNRIGTNGKTIYVAGTEVERGQVMFDLVKDTSGQKIVRMNAYLRPDGDAKLVEILKTEGGEGITKGGPVLGLPARVQAVSVWASRATAAAKTINHHISSLDYAFNTGTLAQAQTILDTIEANPTVRGWVSEGLVSVGDVEKAHPGAFAVSRGLLEDVANGTLPVSAIDDAAAEVTELRTAITFRGHLVEIAEQGSKGSAAQKVGLVPDFDAQAFYVKVKDDALARVEELRSGLIAHVEEAPKVFRSVDRVGFQTSVISARDVNDPVATFTGFGTPGAGATTFKAIADIDGRRATVLYRSAANTEAATQKGWLEVVWETGTTGEVTDADIAALHRWLNDRLGVSARLANSTDMELTYWRMVQGSYEFSQEANRAGSQWAQARTLAKERLSKLGPAPTAEKEIDAIRGAYRQVFGAAIDQADVLPIHSHRLWSDAEEVGWGFWERPEFLDSEVQNVLSSKVIFHNIRYGGSQLSTDHVSAATGSGLLGQQERVRHGFSVSAASASSDVGKGGSGGFFGRYGGFSRLERGDIVVINPARRIRRLLDYNADHDSYGALHSRTGSNTLALPTGHVTEVMMRDMVSYMDDVEIVFFREASVRNQWLDIAKARGVTTIRGVPVDQRWVLSSSVDPTSYAQDFFRRYVNTGERLRRSAESLTSGSVTRITQQATAGLGQDVASRLKLGKVNGSQITKKMSAGRDVRVRIRPPGDASQSVGVRYHVGENAVSVPAGVLDDVLEQTSLPVRWGKAQNTFSSGMQPPGQYSVIDLSIYGIDIKAKAAGYRGRIINELLNALIEGDEKSLSFWATKWGGKVPVTV